MARVALVSGGGRGIGRAISLALAARGDAVAVADLRPEGAAETVSLIEGDGGRAVALELDVTDSESVRSAVAQAGAGPVSASCTCMPRSAAPAISASYPVQLYSMFLGAVRFLAALPTT